MSLFDISSTHAKSNFCVVLNIELFSASSHEIVIGIKRCGIFVWEAEFYWYEKCARWCPPTQTPPQKLKNGVLILNSQGISSRLVSFGMIFEVLQSKLFRFKFHSLVSKILKIPEFNLTINGILYFFTNISEALGTVNRWGRYWYLIT